MAHMVVQIAEMVTRPRCSNDVLGYTALTMSVVQLIFEDKLLYYM
jgi:hypothetical protein